MLFDLIGLSLQKRFQQINICQKTKTYDQIYLYVFNILILTI